MTIEHRLNRIDPVLGPEGYVTYGVAMPRTTHTRPATCQEVDCPNYRHGFTITADTGTELGIAQARYIRRESGRLVSSHEVAGTKLVKFTFPPGQQCFAPHRVSTQRPPIFYKRGGDYRGNPLGLPRLTMRPEDWRDDFGAHQIRVQEQKERG